MASAGKAGTLILSLSRSGCKLRGVGNGGYAPSKEETFSSHPHLYEEISRILLLRLSHHRDVEASINDHVTALDTRNKFDLS